MACETGVQSQIGSDQKMVRYTSLHCMVRVKVKVEQSRERSIAHLCEVAIEKRAFGLPSTAAANFTCISVCVEPYL